MIEILKYFIKLSKKYKTRQGLACISIVIILLGLWVFINFSFSIQLIATSIICSLFLWIIIWNFLRRGYVISKKTKIGFCIKCQDEFRSSLEQIVKSLESSFDSKGLLENFKILKFPEDAFDNIKEAHKFRENHEIDFIFWGDTKFGKIENDSLTLFDLKFTYKINEIIRKRYNLFMTDSAMVIGGRDWSIYEKNSLYGSYKICNNIFEIILFEIGIFKLTEGDYKNAIIILQILIDCLTLRKDINRQMNILYCRSIGILIEAYVNLIIKSETNEQYKDAQKYLLNILKFDNKNVGIYSGLALIEYRLGNIQAAKEYTDKIKRIDNKSPILIVNYGFFSILDKNYDGVYHWYTKAKRMSPFGLNIVQITEFLYKEYERFKDEIAYLFAIGLLNIYHGDKKLGYKELKRFSKLSMNKTHYLPLLKESQRIITFKK